MPPPDTQTSPCIESQLIALDVESADAQRAAGQALAAARSQTSAVPFSLTERQSIPYIHGELDRLESALVERYGSEFAAAGWHGRTSQQRIAWQDEDVLKTLQQPLPLKVILARAHERREMNLGAGNRLSSLLLGGLAMNRPSYLLTASPNWHRKPLVRGVSWSRLSDMAVPHSVEEEPRAVSPAFLQTAAAALRATGEALAELRGREPTPSTSGELQRLTDRASGRSLIGAIISLLDERRATLLVRGEAGASTAIERMNGQCLEVMSEYENLLKANGGRHERVLGYGLVSHALDAKHLAAAMVYGLKLGHGRYRLVTDDTAVNNFERLLDGAARGDLGSPAAELMRARLRQVVRLMADGGGELCISTAEMVAALKA